MSDTAEKLTAIQEKIPKVYSAGHAAGKEIQAEEDERAITAALDELHAYAQALIGGDE